MGAPDLHLDWELGLFRALRGLWRHLASQDKPTNQTHVARLDINLPALNSLAQLVAQAPVQVIPAKDAGGIRGSELYLPTEIAISNDHAINRNIYVLRTTISANIYRDLRHSAPTPPPNQTWLRALQLAWDSAQRLELEFPSFGPAFREASTLCLSGRPDTRSLRGLVRQVEEVRQATLRGERPWDSPNLSPTLRSLTPSEASGPGLVLVGEWITWPDQATHERVATSEEQRPPTGKEGLTKVVEEIRLVHLNPDEDDRSTLVHTFEKVDTADSYTGGSRDTDGDDELDDHLEALEEVDLSSVVRGGSPAQSLIRADIGMGGDIPDVGQVTLGEQGVTYPEWDHSRGKYRPEWCTVYPTSVVGGDPQLAADVANKYRTLILQLERCLRRFRLEIEHRDRQRHGQEIDITSLVDYFAETKAGRTGDDRLYVNTQRQQRDFTTTILLDMSLSSDAWIGGRRVLDVAREAVLVLGEVAHRLGDPLEILAFASHTRHHNRVWELVRRDQSWMRCRQHLFALRPQGYTRMGPALRHSITQLKHAPGRRKVLILVSDGKPTDYDRYEGSYGNNDVKHALREAESLGIISHILAIDQQARRILPEVFGAGAWHLLPRPEALPEALATLYGRLTRS